MIVAKQSKVAVRPTTGVAGQVERGERRVRGRLGAHEAVRTPRLVAAERSKVLPHPAHLVAGIGKRQGRVGHGSRIRIGPLAVDGSTGRPPWLTNTRPSECSRRAAARAGSMSGRQSSPPTAVAASLGQMDAPRGRSDRSDRIVDSSSRSTGRTPRRRHAVEQYRTSSQERSHFLRQTISRPQVAQIFGAASGTPRRYPHVVRSPHSRRADRDPEPGCPGHVRSSTRRANSAA